VQLIALASIPFVGYFAYLASDILMTRKEFLKCRRELAIKLNELSREITDFETKHGPNQSTKKARTEIEQAIALYNETFRTIPFITKYRKMNYFTLGDDVLKSTREIEYELKEASSRHDKIVEKSTEYYELKASLARMLNGVEENLAFAEIYHDQDKELHEAKSLVDEGFVNYALGFGEDPDFDTDGYLSFHDIEWKVKRPVEKADQIISRLGKVS